MRKTVRALTRSRLQTLRHCSMKTKRFVALDVTGNGYSCDPGAAFPQFDDGIMSIITREKNASDIMRTCVKADPTFALGHILLLFEHCRHWNTLPRAKNDSKNGDEDEDEDDLVLSLRALERLSRDGALTERETFLGCALDAWLRGHFVRAGRVLERLIEVSECRHDALVLTLCQESYLLGGRPEDALHCITRSGFLLDDQHLLYGDVLAMLATGLCEAGYLTDAEVAGKKAVKLTRGRSAAALSALINTYLMQGRGSEAYGLVHEHERKHKDTGRLLLLWGGCGAKFLRGEHGAAASYLFQMYEFMEERGVYTRDGIVGCALGVLALEQSHVERQDLQEMALRVAMAASDASHPPLLDSLHGAALASLYSTASRRLAALATPVPGDGLSGEQRAIKRMFGVSSGPAVPSVLTKELSQEDCQGLVADFQDRLAAPPPFQTPMATPDPSQGSNDCLDHHLPNVLLDGIPTLQAIAPAGVVADDEADGRGHDVATIVLAGLRDFDDGDFHSAAKAFRMDSAHAMCGGWAWQRYVLSSMMYTEALLRGGRLLEARTLLSDRAAKAPSDGQAWWRLAAVMDVVGPKHMAQAAHEKANDFGIGQGGFKHYEPYPITTT